MTCCKVIVPPLIKQRRTTRTWACFEYYSHRSSTSCGFLGWGRCSSYSTRRRYVQQIINYFTTYHITDTYLVNDFDPLVFESFSKEPEWQTGGKPSPKIRQDDLGAAGSITTIKTICMTISVNFETFNFGVVLFLGCHPDSLRLMNGLIRSCRSVRYSPWNKCRVKWQCFSPLITSRYPQNTRWGDFHIHLHVGTIPVIERI